MNFKDLYKTANDNISADRKIIDQIYDKAHQKKNFAVLNYRQLSLCAAALVLVIVLTAMPRFYNNSSDSNEGNRIAVKKESNAFALKDNENEENTGLTKTDIQDMTNSDATDNFATEIKDENVIADVGRLNDELINSDENKLHDEDASLKSENSVDDNVSVASETDDTSRKIASVSLSKAEQTDVTSENKVFSNSSSVSKNSGSSGGNVSSGGGSGGGGGSVSGGSYAKPVGITVNEYYNYLNLNIPSLFSSLPKGMTINNPDCIYVTKNSFGQYIDDAASFVALDANDGSKIISISTSRIGGKARDILNNGGYPKKTINNRQVVIFTDDNLCQAYFKYGDVWFEILSSNISTDEFEKFITSTLN